MANVTTSAMFKGAIMLPNTGSTYSEGQQLATFIAQYEAEFIKTFFGYDLGTALIANIGSVTPDADLDRILDGDTYVDSSGVTQEWIGFSNALLQSPIANYIYCKILQARDSQTTGIGEAFPIAENTIRTDAGPKMVNAWNQMVLWNISLYEFMVANESVTAYEDYIGCVSSNSHLFQPLNRFGI
jgi:hypothetical protein